MYFAIRLSYRPFWWLTKKSACASLQRGNLLPWIPLSWLKTAEQTYRSGEEEGQGSGRKLSFFKGNRLKWIMRLPVKEGRQRLTFLCFIHIYSDFFFISVLENSCHFLSAETKHFYNQTNCSFSIKRKCSSLLGTVPQRATMPFMADSWKSLLTWRFNCQFKHSFPVCLSLLVCLVWYRASWYWNPRKQPQYTYIFHKNIHLSCMGRSTFFRIYC